MKKVLALVLAIATLLSFATVASAKTADFADAKDVKNVEAVDVLSYINVLEGYPADKSFKPAKNIAREEAAKIIAIFANKSTDISSLYTSANPFADMKGRWGESYVAYGYRAGIIAGKNATSFVPKANVKGTEFLKMVLVVLGYDQNKEGLVGSSWAVNTLELAKVKGLMKGLDNFDANAALTREQTVTMLYRYAQAAGADVSMEADADLLRYADAGQISVFALPAMQWACGSGVLTGNGAGALNPQGTASRAELATLILRAAELF